MSSLDEKGKALDDDYVIAQLLCFYFAEINSHSGPRMRQRPVLNENSAFQAYQPGATYQPTSQYPSDQMKSHAVNARSSHYLPHDSYNGKKGNCCLWFELVSPVLTINAR